MDSAKKKKILILNNYSVQRVTQEINNGLKPDHHLYGVLQLEESGFELIIIDPSEHRFWNKVSKYINKIPFLEFGDLYQQFSAIKRRKEYDIIYAPCQRVTQLLGLLAYLKLFNKKIIAVAHHPFLVGRLTFLRKYVLYPTLKGHYKWGSLSSKVAKEINAITRSEIAECMHWGPDIEFYDKLVSAADFKNETKPVDIIAIGRTGRDYQVLIDAFNNTAVKVEIYCSKDAAKELTTNHTDNIKITRLEFEESLSYPELIRLYQTAKIMAIPMKSHHGLAGLTSLTDAIALGMPVIMTRNSNIEIDVEKDGFGFWVEPGDSDGWKETTLSILKSGSFKRLSENSRKVAIESYNTDIFFDELSKIIE